MKYQITENEENLFFGRKITQVSVVILRPLNLTTLLTEGKDMAKYIYLKKILEWKILM